jgi:hypothetical protein
MASAFKAGSDGRLDFLSAVFCVAQREGTMGLGKQACCMLLLVLASAGAFTVSPTRPSVSAMLVRPSSAAATPLAVMAAKPKKGAPPAKAEPEEGSSKRNQKILYGLVVFGLLWDYFITHNGLTNFDPSHGPKI